MSDLLQDIHGENPYHGFDTSKYDLDLQGWCNPEFFKKIVKEVRPKSILEIGTWKGKSAIAMADACVAEGLTDTKIVCVDTFLGATEFIGKPDNDPKRGLRKVHGFPTIYFQFLANVVKTGHASRIIPFPQTSTNATRFFSQCGDKFDLIFIDGSHEYEDVASDLHWCEPLLNVGGVMCGDDYCEYWDGVRLAVNDFVDFSFDPQFALSLEHYDNGPGNAPSDYWILREQ